MKRTVVATILIVLALELLLTIPFLVFTSPGQRIANYLNPPPPTPTKPPTPTPTPLPVLTPKAPFPTLHTSVAYLLDNDTDRPLLDMQGETRYPMASTTKIMTAYIVLQQSDLNQQVSVGQDAVDEVNNNMGSSAQLVVGDKLSMQDMLYALMLPSGDDAAIAIADSVSGSAANFVVLMNKYAQELHLKNTHYNNPDGLTYYTKDNKPEPGLYTTAADLAQLTRIALKQPLFAQIVETQSYTLPATADHHGYTWDNTNNLLSSYPGVIGIKTGSTVEAGDCLVFAATNNKHTLIGVVLQETFDAQGSANRFADAAAILDWGFQLPLLPPTVTPPARPKGTATATAKA